MSFPPQEDSWNNPLENLPTSARELRRLFRLADKEYKHRNPDFTEEVVTEIELLWRQASTLELATASNKEELLLACKFACPYVDELEFAIKRLLEMCNEPEDSLHLIPLISEAPESCQKQLLKKAYKLSSYYTTRFIRKILQRVRENTEY